MNLNKCAGDIVCLRDVSIAIKPGEVVSIVGENGSGKTTLLDILSGFIQSESGQVLVNEIVANRKPPSWFARHGILRTFQSPRVFEQMTLLDSLLLSTQMPNFPLFIDTLLPNRPDSRSRERDGVMRAENVLKRVGWIHRKTALSGSLSYGERKLLVALQLSLTVGSLALCDEPIAGLDAQGAEIAMDVLYQWQKEVTSRSIVIATHDLEYVNIKADRTLRLRNGVLTESSYDS
jgi:branched-chain amino acid transport system ATP-binding protein